jgi:uncharacterized protein HemY
VVLGRSFERERLWAHAAEAYETALATGLPPEEAVQALGLAANAWLAARQPERALALLARAPPGDPRFRELSERVRQASGGAPPSS